MILQINANLTVNILHDGESLLTLIAVGSKLHSCHHLYVQPLHANEEGSLSLPPATSGINTQKADMMKLDEEKLNSEFPNLPGHPAVRKGGLRDRSSLTVKTTPGINHWP